MKPDALTAAFLAELHRFCDGAGAGVYLRGETGDYPLAGGDLDKAPARKS